MVFLSTATAALLSLTFACGKPDPNAGDTVLAQVHKKTLRLSELEGMFPEDATTDDSLIIRQAFIRRWIRETALEYEAERNLPPDLNIDRMVREYRSSLVSSHYEEVLIVRVHPGILTGQRLPKVGKSVWRERFESIRNYEQHLARNGTAVVKFFLNVSKDEQRDRLVARIDDETKNWKFEAGDLVSRANWPKYMAAYQSAINATSRPWAPWYTIPADDKPFMRATVASIMRRTLEGLKPKYPSLDEAQTAALAGHRETLLSE